MGRDDNIKKLIARNPVNKGLDYALVDKIMRGVVERHFPELVKIDRLERVNHKRRVGKRHSTFIYSYFIHGTSRNGEKITKHIVYSSHSDGTRLRAYKTLTTLIEGGFNDNKTFKIIVPLEYIDGIQTLIYEAVDGKTLYQHMQENRDPNALSNILQTAAQWISKFHRFSIPDSVFRTIPLFDSLNLNWTVAELVNSVSATNKEQAQKLDAFLKEYTAEEKRLADSFTPALVYGDMHPENIITPTLHPARLTMIDFTDVSRGDQMRDLGSFIQQLYFMGIQFYAAEAVNSLRQSFLEFYFTCDFAQIPEENLKRINLYQAWNSLRGFVYLFFHEEDRPRSYGLLEDALRYLRLVTTTSRTISIDSTYNA